MPFSQTPVIRCQQFYLLTAPSLTEQKEVGRDETQARQAREHEDTICQPARLLAPEGFDAGAIAGLAASVRPVYMQVKTVHCIPWMSMSFVAKARGSPSDS